MNLCLWVNGQVFFQLNCETNFFLASGNQLKLWASWYIFNLAYQHLSLIHRFPLSPALPLVCTSPTVSDISYWIGAFWNLESWGGEWRGRRGDGYIRICPEGTSLLISPPPLHVYLMRGTFTKGCHWSKWAWNHDCDSLISTWPQSNTKVICILLSNPWVPDEENKLGIYWFQFSDD